MAKKIFAQFRCTNGYFRSSGVFFLLNKNEICSFCNLGEKETLEHFVLQCKMYQVERSKIADLTSGNQITSLMACESKDSIQAIACFLAESLKLRQFVLDNETD